MLRFLIGVVIALLMVMPGNISEASQNSKPQLTESTPITSGAVLKQYDWQTDGGKAKISVIEVDLKNPHVQIDVIPGKGKITERLNVSAMAKNTGAVAAINGDFYNTQIEGVPIGPMVMGERLVASPSQLEGLYALGITKDRQAYIDAFTFDGKAIAPSGAEFKLSGLNRAVYWEEPDGSHSHAQKLHLYNDLWGGKTRGQDTYTTPTEMLIQNGVVQEILVGKYFDYAVPKGMYILRGHGEAAKFITENFKPGDRIELDYDISPNKNWSMVIGGHALLINDGKKVPYTRNLSALGGVRARTAAGISKDGNTLYLVAAEGRTANSVGLSLTNLSVFFESIGAWKALNLDGGGSTTMVSRPLGEWEVERVFPTEQTTERLVVNALGVYSNAPSGKVEGLLISGEELLLINEETSYSLKGYDNYYNPIDASQLSMNWKETGNLGTYTGNKFKPTKAGSTEITASVDNAKVKLPIKVIGKNDVAKMEVKNKNNELSITLRAKDGTTKNVPANLVNWQIFGFKGQVSPQGILTINDTAGNKLGFVVARYQGFSAPLALYFEEGQKEAFSFGKLEGLSFEGYPKEVTGKITNVDDPEQPGKKVLNLEYDFTQGTGTTAAYLNFNEGQSTTGVKIPEDAQGVEISVYGNKGNEWVRAEFEDDKGNVHRLELTQGLNWSGWKTINLDTTALPSPLTLKRIYAVTLEGQREERSLEGNIMFKNLIFKGSQSGGVMPPTEKQKSLELTIGKKILLADGKSMEMDVAPVVIDGRTLVPVRFISEALDSTVLWDADARNATIIKDNSWIDLWPGESLMVVNGNANNLDVPPKLINGRTMLPLRAVSESLNLTVNWDEKTQKIKLY